MAMKRTLDRSSIIRFTGVGLPVLEAKLEGAIYRKRFPLNFARDLIRGIWRARHVPDIKQPRLKMHDVYATLEMGYSTLRKCVASGELGPVRYDVNANTLLSLEQFFYLAGKVGKREWVPEEHPITRPNG